MNLFTKSILAGIIPCAAVSGQGLYSIAPNDDEATSSLPLTFLAGVNVGYDDNPTPINNGDSVNDGSGFVSAFVQANIASVSPQTTWDVYARVGAQYYFQDLDGDNIDSVEPNARVGVNLTHRFSERLRFSSRNFVAYENEPDFDFGFGGDRRTGEYFRYSSSNTVGYRWTDRLGTSTGAHFQGQIFPDLDGSDFTTFGFSHQFRYRLSPATVATAGYRYSNTNRDTGNDASSHFLTGGIEHRISPASAVTFRAGVQISDVDGGDTQTRPFFEGALRSQLTEQLGANVFVRYSNENFNNGFTDGDGVAHIFDENQTIRLGAKLNYSLNPRVSLFGGVNLIYTDFDELDGSESGPGASDGDETLLNLNVGFSYALTDALFLTGSYNYTESFSDFSGRDYDRNRAQLGLQATF